MASLIQSEIMSAATAITLLALASIPKGLTKKIKSEMKRLNKIPMCALEIFRDMLLVWLLLHELRGIARISYVYSEISILNLVYS